MYDGKNTLIRASVDRREACSPDVILSKNLFFDSLKPPGKGPAANGHNYIYTIILESPRFVNLETLAVLRREPGPPCQNPPDFLPSPGQNLQLFPILKRILYSKRQFLPADLHV